MIVADGLTWRGIRALSIADTGGDCREYRCVEHPRLTRMVQRPNRDADAVETFHVKGVSTQHWHSAREAIAAAEANPCLARRVSDDQALTRCDQYPQCPCGGPEGWR